MDNEQPQVDAWRSPPIDPLVADDNALSPRTTHRSVVPSISPLDSPCPASLARIPTRNRLVEVDGTVINIPIDQDVNCDDFYGVLRPHGFSEAYIKDDCYVNWDPLTKIQGSVWYSIVALGMIFTGVGLRFFSYNWDWPPALIFLKSSNPTQANVCFAFAALFLLSGNLLFISAHNKQISKMVYNTFEFWFLSFNFLAFAVGDTYDIGTTTEIHPVGVVAGFIAYIPACQTLFAVDAFSPKRGGRRPIKILFFLVAATFFILELVLWRWMRPTRHEVIHLPFYEATIGGMVGTLGINNLLYNSKIILAALFLKRTVLVIKTPLDIQIFSDDEQHANGQGQGLKDGGVNHPQSSTILDSVVTSHGS